VTQGQSLLARARQNPKGQGAEEIQLLGVRFDRLERKRALETLASAFGQRKALKVYIVNAHALNLACADEEFRAVLNQAEILLNDGSGVQLASRLAGKPFPDNLVGTDLTPQLCQIAAEMGVGVFLLGGLRGVPEKAAIGLREIVPGVTIAGVHHGYFERSETSRVVESINASGAGILLVALGNPLQEKWIHANASSLRCDVCIGVGGLFDHWSGRLRRAPLWMRRLGIEWVQILLQQPSKWQRYLLGNPVFVFRAVRERLGWTK
jgi:N-acetylglucosaminyldiphosphoundecaprenol N-acetyl-beta-D-mannosaminyltransferase